MSSSLGVECTQQSVHNKASNDSEDVVCWRKKTRDKYLEYKKKKSYISDRREQVNILIVLTRESDPSYYPADLNPAESASKFKMWKWKINHECFW